jgi:hypothetical protein
LSVLDVSVATALIIAVPLERARWDADIVRA